MNKSDSGTKQSETDPIARVKAADGELVLDYNSRVGARPFVRYVDGE